LALMTATPEQIKEADGILSKAIKPRSIRCSRSILNPLFGSIPLKDYIKIRLHKLRLTPRGIYRIHEWGCSNDDWDPDEWANLPRKGKLIDIIEF